jgi:hypothetical protein
LCEGGPKEDPSKCKNIKETNPIIACQSVNIGVYHLLDIFEGWGMLTEREIVVEIIEDLGNNFIILRWDKGR